MKGLPLLIKLKQQALDETQLKLTRLREEEAQLKNALDLLHKEIEHEQEVLQQFPQARQIYTAYRERIKKKEDTIKVTLEVHAKAIESCMTTLQELFKERKTYELAEEMQNQREATLASKAEQNFLDELMITRQEEES